MSKKIPYNILHSLKNQQWLILPQSLELMIDIAYRENLEQHAEALLARDGEPLSNTSRTIQRESTAIIPINGPIFPKANLFTEISGATSLEMLAKDFNSALENPEIKSIIFEVDSPGGSVNGLSEMSDMIFKARGQKPIIAFVTGMGASAAYFIASAADKMIIAPEAMVGAIGTIVNIVDTTEADKKAGVNVLRFTSKVSPLKNLEPTSKKGAEQIQDVVDTLGEIFVEAVARNRGVTNEKVLNDFGQGGILIGRDALNAGMVDSVSSLEDTILNLNNTKNKSANLTPGGIFMDPKDIANLTVSDLKAHNLDLYNEIMNSTDTVTLTNKAKAEGVAEGIQAENTRIKEIEAMKNSTNAKILDAIKFDTTINKGQAAIKVVESQQQAIHIVKTDIKADNEEILDSISELTVPETSGQVELEQKKKLISNIAAAGSRVRPVNHRAFDKIKV